MLKCLTFTSSEVKGFQVLLPVYRILSKIYGLKHTGQVNPSTCLKWSLRSSVVIYGQMWALRFQYIVFEFHHQLNSERVGRFAMRLRRIIIVNDSFDIVFSNGHL